MHYLEFREDTSNRMKTYNLVASLVVLFSTIMQFEIFAKFGQVEAKGKGKKVSNFKLFLPGE